MALAAIADDGDLLALDQVDVGVAIVIINAHVRDARSGLCMKWLDVAGLAAPTGPTAPCCHVAGERRTKGVPSPCAAARGRRRPCKPSLDHRAAIVTAALRWQS